MHACSSQSLSSSISAKTPAKIEKYVFKNNNNQYHQFIMQKQPNMVKITHKLRNISNIKKYKELHQS